MLDINDTDGNIRLDVEGEVRTWYVTLPKFCLSGNVANAVLLCFACECKYTVILNVSELKYLRTLHGLQCECVLCGAVLCLSTTERHVTE